MIRRPASYGSPRRAHIPVNKPLDEPNYIESRNPWARHSSPGGLDRGTPTPSNPAPAQPEAVQSASAQPQPVPSEPVPPGTHAITSTVPPDPVEPVADLDPPEYIPDPDVLAAAEAYVSCMRGKGAAAPAKTRARRDSAASRDAARSRKRTKIRLARRRKSMPARDGEVSDQVPDLKRHARKCEICRHPDRELIEEAFLLWENVYNLVRDFELPDQYTVYRHAHALGLFELRGRNVRSALEHLIGDANRVKATPDSIIRAVRAYACITDYVKWVEPATTHFVVPALPPGVAPALQPQSGPLAQPALPDAAPDLPLPKALPAAENVTSNRN